KRIYETAAKKNIDLASVVFFAAESCIFYLPNTKTQSKELLFSSFDKVYAYEYIIDAELSNNDKN
ncbi:MAG: hypothetical protein PWR23_1821, partial [Peptostreptococcaceae bacterium]|nr:hypothetical protein [Peptostreptococcaceae bacterium]